jgi:hypothetical protein
VPFCGLRSAGGRDLLAAWMGALGSGKGCWGDGRVEWVMTRHVFLSSRV